MPTFPYIVTLRDYSTDKPEYERPAGRSVTLLKSLYLQKYTSELHAVLTVNFPFNKKMTATDWTQLWGRPGGEHVPRDGCQNGPPSHNSGTAGPIVAKFGMWLETM